MRGLQWEESRLGKMGRKMDHSLAAGPLPALAILGCGHRCLFLSWIPFLVVCKIPIELSNRVQLCVQRPVVGKPMGFLLYAASASLWCVPLSSV